MTYKEWMERTGARFQMNAGDVELLLCNVSDLIPDANAQVDVRKAKLALCREFSSLIPMANISEGGYSVSWNMSAIQLWYHSASEELGLTPVDKPRITNKSALW
jgi:hypothetical protein